MPRLNLLVSDDDFRRLLAVSRSVRLNPGVWARMVVMREVDRLVAEGVEVKYTQGSLSLPVARGPRGKR